MGEISYKMNEINNLKDEFSKMLYDFFDRKDKGVIESDFTPPIDVIEKEDRLIVEMEIPGVGKEDIDVFFSNGVLTIKGTKKYRVSDEKDLFHRIERNYGKFHRNISISYPIDEQNIKAEVKKGVLVLILSKIIENPLDKKINVLFED